MLRSLVVAVLFIASLVAPAWSPSPSPIAPAKKQGPKAKAAAKPAGAVADSGPCQTGVIPALGDKFVLEHIGLPVFGNEFTDASVGSWGLDDLVVARARAAAPGRSVRRIPYARDAFEPFYHPPRELF